VLLKEQAYSGWTAHTGSGTKLPVFRAGPTNPGFVYVPLPEESRNEEIVLEYKGEQGYKLYTYLWLAVLLIIFDYTLLRGFVIGRLISLAWKKLHSHTAKWWEKDDIEEY
ncbi:MAG TPA: hypothetical protein VJ179_02305, partial [Patescibacteria group bacterium]|nr:hypothetical protein [Patescibacteria group bacterium]